MRFYNGLATVIKRRWREALMWLILACYLGVLWWLASKYWHVLHFFAFIVIFLALVLLVIIAFRMLRASR